MDKLRSLQYFTACAREGSLSGAARGLHVSVAAVAKLLGALERELGVRLFERSAQGLALTASGASYLEACLPALESLADADEQVRGSAGRVRGNVVVAVQHQIAQACLAPALPAFHARYPEIQLDLRDFAGHAGPQAEGVDVFLSLGWPQVGDMVHRQIGAAGFIVCAAPAYWAAHGIPQRPRDLEGHVCLLINTPDGTVFDLWSFARGNEKEAVTVRGWLLASNRQRDVVVRAALAGEGVVRFLDWTNPAELASGALVPVLLDWDAADAPPINLVYRPSVRRTARVRAVIDFVTEIFRDVGARQRPGVVSAAPPRWRRGRFSRASAIVARSSGPAGR